MNTRGPSAESGPPAPVPAAPGSAAGTRGVRYALLIHPTVQAVRFGTKLSLTWLLSQEAFGESVLAGSLAFLGGHLALLGLDEAWIHARRPGPRLLAALTATHRKAGALVGLATVLAGVALALLQSSPRLGWLLASLGPMVALANLAVLPTARLVRERDFRRLFAVDLGAVLSLAVVTLGAAALGAGSFALVAGWYANAGATWLGASRAVRAHALPQLRADEEDDEAQTRRYGKHLFGASLCGFLGLRMDGWAVGFGPGPAALGLYEQAQHVGTLMLTWSQQFGDRALFPALSARQRAQHLAPALATLLRAGLAWLLPAHLVLAVLAAPLVALIFPADWAGIAGLLPLLAWAAGARCLDDLCTTTLKAADRSSTVARLGVVRVLLLGLALALALPGSSVQTLALAVVIVRLVTALLALQLACRAVPLPRRSGVVPAALSCALFAAAAEFGLRPWLEAQALAPLAALALGSVCLLGAWLLCRLLADARGLAADGRLFAHRVLQRGQGAP